jgi:hypothetical protein
MGAPLLVFAGIWYDMYVIIFWLPTIRDCVMKEEEFDDLEDWLVFFYTLFCNSWR